MSLYRRVRMGLARLLDRRRADQDLDDEVRHYLEMSAQDKLRGGSSSDEAARSARLEFGGVEMAKENVRGYGWEARVDAVTRDLRYAARSLRRSPAFTLTSVITLALGIGANTAMFSVVNAVLLRPLPYADPDRLVTLWTDDPRHGGREEGTSNLNYLDWRRRARSFIDMAVVSRGSPAMLGGAEPERVNGEDISANVLPLLGVQPMIGRNLLPEEEFQGQTAILSYGLWQRRFGGRPQIVGETIELDGSAVRVIGVMPRGFFFPTRATQIWLSSPLADREKTQRTQDTWRVIGRLRTAVSPGDAQREMTAIGDQLAREYPVTDPGFAGYAVNVVPMLTQVIGASLPFALWLLLGAVTLVLAIACVNVANLLIVRGTARGHELALRAALGASHSRLARQLFAESVLLSGAAAIAGVLVAFGIMRLLALSASALPRMDEIGVDGRVLAFTATSALGAAMVFGLAPAWQAARRDPIDALREGGVRSGGSRAMRRARGALVVAECALAVVLLAGAGLLMKSLARLHDVDAGFRSDGALLVRIALPPRATEEQEHRSPRGDERMEHIVERVRSLPGVTGAGAIRDFVFNKNPDWVITTDGARPLSTLDVGGELTSEYIGPGFITAVGARVAAGREFTNEDFHTPGAAMINESFAMRYFPGVNPLGQRFKLGGPTSRSAWHTVIGVVRDLHRGGLERRALPEFYTPWYARNMDIVVRADGDVTALAAAIRRIIRQTEPGAAITRLLPLVDEFGDTGAQRRLNTILLASFAALALLMSAVGLYGLMHYLVASRAHEIAVRIAMGARMTDAMALVIREGMFVAGAGVALGLAGALAVAGLMSRLVFGMSARDPLSIVGGGAVLGLVALVACALPARRAARLDPMIALRRG